MLLRAEAEPASPAPATDGAAGPVPGQQPHWRRDAEKSGPLRALEWGGVTRTAASWARRWGVLHRGHLYQLESQDAPAAASSTNIWLNRRVRALPCWNDASVMLLQRDGWLLLWQLGGLML